MHNDEYLQEARLANLVAGLGRFWRRSEMQRIVFARVLVEHDHLLGSVITARVYESVLREMMEYYGILRGVFGKIDLTLVRGLERRSEIVSLGLRPGELEALWKLRHEAVHGYLGFTPQKAKLFVQGVEEFWRAWRKRFSKSR
jgi:hypothetical protein